MDRRGAWRLNGTPDSSYSQRPKAPGCNHFLMKIGDGAAKKGTPVNSGTKEIRKFRNKVPKSGSGMNGVIEINDVLDEI